MDKQSRDNTIVRRAVSLCLFFMIMVVYISIQLYWGLNLYKSFVNEERKGLNDLFSRTITAYASTSFSNSADDPDSPIFTMERVSPNNDSVLSNAVVTEVVKKPEELTGTLEKVFIAASIKTDPLFINRLAQSFEAKLLDRDIYSFQLFLRKNGTVVDDVSTKLIDKTYAFFPIKIEVGKEFNVDEETYTIGSTLITELPQSLMVLALLFVIGIFLLVIILYLLISMTKRVEAEKEMNHQQELFFYGLVHDLKLPLSLAHSLIDGLASTVEVDEKSHAGLIEADNHILKLTDDINMLLTMYRIKQNKKSEARRIYLYDIVQDIIIEIEAHYPEKKISFTIDFPNDLIMVFSAEELKLILRVFLDNAVKYNQEHPKVTIQAAPADRHISIMIEDDGNGIHLFKDSSPYTLHPSLIRQICKDCNGGIGIMTAWTIVNAKGGKIIYNRKSPKGSLFTLSIPKEEI
ncbi:MAG: HAMP domain-containing sensor histidine kinase [Porphyromonas sp.]|nr:HAMP domain-containing sensor histidine kinase [Porphyromonas sp.]